MPEYELALLHAKWCGHCVRFYPENEKNNDNEKNNENKNENKNKNKKGGSKALTWGEVKKEVKIPCVEFEEGDLEKEHKGYDIKSIKEAAQGWPTLVFLVRNNNNENFRPHSYFEGNRTNINDFHKAIESISEKNSILSGGGINMVNKYRTKYKKYKQLYADLMVKYKQLNH
jgi:hypothetical protein